MLTKNKFLNFSNYVFLPSIDRGTHRQNCYLIRLLLVGMILHNIKYLVICYDNSFLNIDIYTVCPKSSDPFYVVTYYKTWVTTSWT